MTLEKLVGKMKEENNEGWAFLEVICTNMEKAGKRKSIKKEYNQMYGFLNALYYVGYVSKEEYEQLNEEMIGLYVRCLDNIKKYD